MRSRRSWLTAATAVLGVTGATLIAVAVADQERPPLPPASAAGSTGSTGALVRHAPTAGRVAPRPGRPRVARLRPATPTTIRIPSIGVRAPLVRLGRDSDGSAQVPVGYHVGGWYTGSVTPGEVGAAVILGHLDSTAGPGVFYRLGDLRPGDRVLVTRKDGRTVAFRITGVRAYRKDRFPTREVYADPPIPSIRLVTCGGAFDPTTRHYRSNVVAYGELVGLARTAAG